jgi:hypothetical protein
MKKNNLLILSLPIIFLMILSACIKDRGPEDPLILPPNFAEMPDVNSANQTMPPKSIDPDTEKLRELLLKSN